MQGGYAAVQKHTEREQDTCTRLLSPPPPPPLGGRATRKQENTGDGPDPVQLCTHLGQEAVDVDLVDLLRVLGRRVHHNRPQVAARRDRRDVQPVLPPLLHVHQHARRVHVVVVPGGHTTGRGWRGRMAGEGSEYYCYIITCSPLLNPLNTSFTPESTSIIVISLPDVTSKCPRHGEE